MAKCRYSRSYDIVREPGNYLNRNGAKRYLMPKKPTNIVKSKTKISAIKILRRFTECNLKDAKEAIDARQIKIEKGW